jgi:transposase
VAEAAENRELRRRNKQLEQEVEILRRATAYFARDTLPKLVWSWRKTERQR